MPKPNIPDPVFVLFVAEAAPGGCVSAAEWEQGAHPAPQVCRAGLSEAFSCPGGLSQHEIKSVFLPETAR